MRGGTLDATITLLSAAVRGIIQREDLFVFKLQVYNEQVSRLVEFEGIAKSKCAVAKRKEDRVTVLELKPHCECHTAHAPHGTHPTLYTPHTVHTPHCTHPTLYTPHTVHIHTAHTPHCTRPTLYTPTLYTSTLHTPHTVQAPASVCIYIQPTSKWTGFGCPSYICV